MGVRLKYVVEVEPLEVASWRGVPASERLKRWVKATGRSYGLRVRSIRPVKNQFVFRAVEDGRPVVDGTQGRGAA